MRGKNDMDVGVAGGEVITDTQEGHVEKGRATRTKACGHATVRPSMMDAPRVQ